LFTSFKRDDVSSKAPLTKAPELFEDLDLLAKRAAALIKRVREMTRSEIENIPILLRFCFLLHSCLSVNAQSWRTWRNYQGEISNGFLAIKDSASYSLLQRHNKAAIRMKDSSETSEAPSPIMEDIVDDEVEDTNRAEKEDELLSEEKSIELPPYDSRNADHDHFLNNSYYNINSSSAPVGMVYRRRPSSGGDEDEKADDDSILIANTNKILTSLGIAFKQIISMDSFVHVAPSMFVAIVESLFKMKIDGIIRSPRSKSDYIHNAQLMIDCLSEQLKLDLSYITGEMIVEGNTEALSNLVSICLRLLTLTGFVFCS
jgi:hypothetical protein